MGNTTPAPNPTFVLERIVLRPPHDGAMPRTRICRGLHAVRAQSSQNGARLPRARPKSGGLYEAHGPELVDNVACRTLPLVMRPLRATIVNTTAGEGKTSCTGSPSRRKNRVLLIVSCSPQEREGACAEAGGASRHGPPARIAWTHVLPEASIGRVTLRCDSTAWTPGTSQRPAVLLVALGCASRVTVLLGRIHHPAPCRLNAISSRACSARARLKASIVPCTSLRST